MLTVYGRKLGAVAYYLNVCYGVNRMIHVFVLLFGQRTNLCKWTSITAAFCSISVLSISIGIERAPKTYVTQPIYT